MNRSAESGGDLAVLYSCQKMTRGEHTPSVDPIQEVTTGLLASSTNKGVNQRSKDITNTTIKTRAAYGDSDPACG